MGARTVEMNKIYRDFNGNLFKTLYMVRHSETLELMIVYQALYGNKIIYVTPYDIFISEVDHNEYPNVKQAYKFELV